MALIFTAMREVAANLAQRVRHVELSGRPDFPEQFVEELGFERSMRKGATK